jgi:hypothetical protein
MGETLALKEYVGFRGIVGFQLFGKALEIQHYGMVAAEEVYQVGGRKQVATVRSSLHFGLTR